MILPYYKIERTEEGRQFFFSSSKGYFNFWDQYLIMKLKGYEQYSVLVNRPNRKFSGVELTEDYKVVRNLHIGWSMLLKNRKKCLRTFQSYWRKYERKN